MRQWGKPGVAWWVSSETLPPDTEAALRAAGGKQIDAVQILARELDGDEAGLAVPGDVSVELVAGERAFRAASVVTVRGWGRKEPTGAVLAREYAEAVTGPGGLVQLPRAGLGAGRARRGRRVHAARGGGSRCGARSPCGSTVGAAPTGRCWPSGCGWPAPTAPRWPW